MKNKRFIAGATCPQCKAIDKIFTYEEQGSKWRACVNCHFNENDDMLNKPAEELPTRVNQHRLGEKPLAHEVPTEKINLKLE